MSDYDLMGAPESTVIAIVELYHVLRGQGVAHQDCIAQIEQHRASAGTLKVVPDIAFHTYVKLRTKMEHARGRPLREEDFDKAIFLVEHFIQELSAAKSTPGSFLIEPNTPDYLLVDPVKAYKVGETDCLLFAGVRPIAAAFGQPAIIEYPLVLVAFESLTTDPPLPELMITLETSVMTSGSRMLCCFDQFGGHRTLGQGDHLSEPAAFAATALQMVQEVNETQSPPREVALPTNWTRGTLAQQLYEQMAR